MSKWNIEGFRKTLLVNKLNSLINKPLDVDNLYRTLLIDLLIKEDVSNLNDGNLIHQSYKEIQITCDRNGKCWLKELCNFIEHGSYNSIYDLSPDFKPYHKLLIDYYNRLTYFTQVYILNDEDLEVFTNHISPVTLAKYKKASQVYILNAIFYGKKDTVVDIN